MSFGKGRRRLWFGLGFVVIGLAAIWFSLPMWLPWVLRPLAARAGAHFTRYERRGYGRFALHELNFTNHALIFHAHRVEALVPSVWLWRVTTGYGAGAEPFLGLDTWECELLPTGKPAASPYAQIQDVTEALFTVQRWLPGAVLGQGTVRSGKLTVALPEATWSSGQLKARIALPPQIPGGTITAVLTLARPLELQLGSASLRLDSKFVLATNLSGLDIQNSTSWQSNRFELRAHFAPSESLPASATLRSSDFRFPGQWLKLPEYDQLGGSLSAQWNQGQFALDVTVLAHPSVEQTNLPPIDIDLHAHGDTNSATIQKLVIHAPFFEANLSNEVGLSFAPPYLHGTAALNLAADLARQPWIPLTGNLSGEVAIQAAEDKLPLARLHLAGSDLGAASLRASAFDLAGNLDWPTFKLAAAELRFSDGSTATVSGTLDLENKTATEGRFRFDGPLVQRWLPSECSYRSLSFSGTFHGPLENLSHNGQLKANQVITPLLRPVSLSMKWNGKARNLEHFDLMLSATNASLSTEGSLAISTNGAQLRLTGLSLFTNQLAALQLSAPFVISFTPAKAGTGWRLANTPFRWSGPAGELVAQAALEWPDEGALEVSLQRFPLRLLDEFTIADPPSVDIRRLTAAAHWTNGPAILRLDLAGSGLAQAARGKGQAGGPQSVQPGAGASETATDQILSTPLDFDLNLVGDGNGIVLSNLVVNSPTSAVVVARGFLPLSFTPGVATNFVNFNPRQRLILDASVRPEAFFWEHFARLTGVRLQEPDLNLKLTGTWQSPEGSVVFRARNIQIKETKLPPLGLEDLRLSLALDREKAVLTEGQVLVQGQRVSVTGELPLGQNSWMGLLHKNLPDWEKTTARLRIQDAELAPFAPIFPEFLAPQGELNVDLSLLPGAGLQGALILHHARTRPLGNTAPLRDINVTLRFDNRELKLESATANLSGAGVALTGRVDMRGTNWLAGELPPFELTVRGTNVPLARAPEYIIRSDLNLTIGKTNGAPPIVLGTVRLRDSFYLSDLSDLIPTGATSPDSRPPYFSIDNPTLADWRLGVTVEGLRWLKLRTSLFNGEVSANLHLQGTLKDPIALGGLKIDSGVVRFPFANFQVQQGLVSLTSENPYRPQLLVRANSKQFSYDMRIEVTGPVDVPVIQFTSNPSLSSEQILLMITAGQLPQGSFALTPQQRAQTVALFLGRDLLAKLGYGDQSQERLTIRSGEEISEQGRSTYNVEYKLTDRWAVVGEYDRFGDFNAGFKWRIYSK